LPAHWPAANSNRSAAGGPADRSPLPANFLPAGFFFGVCAARDL
jgi:hypothetical protein